MLGFSAEGQDRAAQRDRMVAEVDAMYAETRSETGLAAMSPAVRAALGKVERHRLVPPGEASRAYRNHPLPIGSGQTISQPYIVALSADLLDPRPGDVVLEVGTGSGYQAAVLAEVVSRVYSIGQILQAMNLSFQLNGKPWQVDCEPQETLAEVLRNTLNLNGTKVSCEVQVCGACTVLIDGAPVSACTYLAYEARGKNVTTIEGLERPDGALHPLQQAFIDEFAFQCGYCTPGMIMSAKALLDENPKPTRDEIIHYMDGNICRCTGYVPIVAAIQRAAEMMSKESKK